MSQQTLEERVAELERQITAMKANGWGEPKKDWRRTFGMFAGDEVMKEIDKEALKIREADRRKARRMYAKKRKARS